MYDWPELRAETDAFWSRTARGLRRRGLQAPDVLDRQSAVDDLWQSPDLILGQTCGLPLVTGRCAAAVVVGRPDYALPGASGGHYCSAIVMRKAEGHKPLASLRAAINEWGSQSGCHALVDWARERGQGSAHDPLFADTVISGAHRASARLVSEGAADIAAIDAVAWSLVGLYDPDVAAVLEVFAWTRAMPALPYLTSARFAASLLDIRGALDEASGVGAPSVGLPSAVVAATSRDYEPIARMARSVTGLRLGPRDRPLAPVVVAF